MVGSVQGGEGMTPAEALRLLRQSRDDTPALVWHDNGRTVAQLAHTAGVRVEYIHCDLTAQTCERRVMNERSKSE